MFEGQNNHRNKVPERPTIIVPITVVLALLLGPISPDYSAAAQQESAKGVCPPFHLLDKEGNVIDPVHDTNAKRPYSPKQTCGRCHNYETITEGYCFTMGKGEDPTPDQATRCKWVHSPGMYGGTWSTPGPLFRWLSPKKNASPKTMDLTSFDFITAGCANCHPGGGVTELDRDGKRYDYRMADPACGFTAGGENNFDGDYYKARWSETGVLEADCFLCHMPEYDIGERNKQIKSLNFCWAATAGANLAAVTGSVKAGTPVKASYDVSKFNPDGTLSPHIVVEPRNNACLACHAARGWKNRGANFRPRTDVHLRAGLKCTDCHQAGSRAFDPRINGYEEHHIGKGDDPGGHVREDLDNTVQDCSSCHTTGRLGAPVADHNWLAPLHLDKIACQTCHIPQRTVKAVGLQASDVFNPGAKIPTKGKHLWTFYDSEIRYWNHFGELAMMGFDDKPTDYFTPVRVQYKGKIYPVNRVHTTWPGIEVEGQFGLLQPKMGSIYKMWDAHKQNPNNYSQLSLIKDDNNDGVAEVNRSQEIDALITEVTHVLEQSDYPMKGKHVVWVMNDRIYTSGTTYHTMKKHLWEASPYGNVHKYNHDVYPAGAALGANGCTDCHHPSSSFFFGSVVKYPFDEQAKIVTEPQYKLLGLSKFWTIIGAYREAYLKPVIYGLLIALACAGIVLVGQYLLIWGLGETAKRLRFLPWLAGAAVGVVALSLVARPDLMTFVLPSRFWLDSHHPLIGGLVFAIAIVTLISEIRARRMRTIGFNWVLRSAVAVELALSLVIASVAGALMLFKIPGLDAVTRTSYTMFDVGLVLVLTGTVCIFLLQAAVFLRKEVYNH
ncbi:MAG: hypothetical protein J7M40_07200 [Planctomycetes bacterium]|nr:hypothetical protein [Planctomycetota bacterium]